MTTAVIFSCPEGNHGGVAVVLREFSTDDSQPVSTTVVALLGPGEVYSSHVHTGQNFIVRERTNEDKPLTGS